MCVCGCVGGWVGVRRGALGGRGQGPLPSEKGTSQNGSPSLDAACSFINSSMAQVAQVRTLHTLPSTRNLHPQMRGMLSRPLESSSLNSDL